jgi:hypothetical protein
MEYRFWIGTIAGLVLLTPEREARRKYCEVEKIWRTYCSILQINLVAQHDKWEVLGISRTSLDQELVAPRIKVLECVGSSCVEDENAAISTAVEGNAERLESFLTSGVPDLQKTKKNKALRFIGCFITK